jgi:hypothetical protein
LQKCRRRELRILRTRRRRKKNRSSMKVEVERTVFLWPKIDFLVVDDDDDDDDDDEGSEDDDEEDDGSSPFELKLAF